MNAYIDLGAFRGSYINRFKRSKFYIKDMIIFAFECNPYLKHINYGKDVNVIHKAAWIFDGEIDFYISKKNPAAVQGSSIYKEKITGNLDTGHPVKVGCIDFSKFLRGHFSESDKVFLKCNIEGAEYDVLEKCIADGTITLIKHAWILCHYQRCRIPIERHNNLILNLKKYPIVLHNGYGDLK